MPVLDRWEALKIKSMIQSQHKKYINAIVFLLVVFKHKEQYLNTQ